MMTEEELPLCKCGCGERVTKSGNRFVYGHHRRSIGYQKKQQIPILCECGCGEYALPGNRFIYGHNRKGEHQTPEAKKKNADAHMGIPRTLSAKAAITAGKLGTHYSPEHCAAISRGLEESGANDKMRGGNDIVKHHYIYDHNDLSLNTVQMTRSDHMKLHQLFKKLGYIVPQIHV